MKFVLIFFLTISTFCWKGTECKNYVNEVVAEIVDIAEGRTKFSCFKAFGKMYESLNEIYDMYSEGPVDNRCISSFEELLDVMNHDKRRFHELSLTYEKLGSLPSCRIFFNLVHQKKRLYTKMAKMRNSLKQEKFCLEKVKQRYEKWMQNFVKVVKALRKVKEGKYTKMWLNEILQLKTIPIDVFAEL